MTGASDQPTGAPGSADTKDLRVTLGQMRLAAEVEIQRLNRRLAEREAEIVARASSVAEQQALKQELDTLRRSLADRERTLGRITEECRRLEDVLEDQHLAFDGLRQEVERKELSLQAARDEVAALQRRLAGAQQHLSAVSGAEPRASAGKGLVSARRSLASAGRRLEPRIRRLAPALGIGLGAAAVGALLFWGGAPWELPRLWSEITTPPAAVVPTPKVAEELAAAEEEDPSASDAPSMAGSQSEGLRLARPDKLRDGGLGPVMVPLAGGRFRMGKNTLAGGDTGPERDLSVAPFLLSAHEVTFQQYDRFARATGRSLPDDFGWGRGNRPVVGVAWSDAQAYADWLTRQTGKRYRLPSESEWEFAARAGVQALFPWGFWMEPGRAVCFDCGTRWDNKSTAPVGSFAPNAFGLFDLAGNAMEWVADCYVPSYDGAPDDSRPWTVGDCTARVARGGAYNRPSSTIRTYTRNQFPPATRLDMLGFRVAREP